MRWADALAAADALLADVYRLPVTKALDPQNPADFLVLQHRLATALKGLTGKAEAQAMKAALATLDVNWGAMTAAGRDKVIEAARAVLAKPPPVLPEVAAMFEAAGVKTVKGAKQSFKEAFGAKIAVDLTAADARVIGHAASAAALYVKDQYGVRADAISANARKIVSEGLAQGLGRYELAKDLRDGLAAQGVARSDAYWNMAAGVFVNRSRVYGNLSGYQDARITHYRIDAVMDEVTTVQCRFMNGRIFEVGHALGLYAATAASDDPEDVKHIQPWMGVAKNDAGELALHYKDAAGAKQQVAVVTSSGYGKLDDAGAFDKGLDADALSKAGLLTPPFHGNCRTTTRPVFGAAPAPLPRPAFALTPPPRDAGVPTTPPPPAPVFVPREQKALIFGPGGLKPSPIFLYAEQQALLFGDAPGIVPKPIYVPSAKELLLSDLKKLLAEKPNATMAPPKDLIPPVDDVWGEVKMPFPKLTGPQLGGAKNKKAVSVPLDNLVLSMPASKMWQVEQALTYVDEVTYAPTVVKLGGKFYLYEKKDAAFVMGQHALASKSIQAKVVDLDAVKKVPKPKAPKPGLTPGDLSNLPPPTGKPASLPPPAFAQQLSAAEVMSKKVAGPSGGSNNGQTYEGEDGVRRFVKVYKNPAQAHGEHLANRFYIDLGLGAPESTVFDLGNGQTGYASALLEGETLGSAGLTKARAQEFMKGFVADVLTANWDAAGQSLDNAFVTKGGKVVRIDNGGSFLYRAQGGLKPDHALDQISEWEVFFSPKNGSYLRIANAAGYDDPNHPDFRDQVAKQIEHVFALRDRAGGWAAYVKQTSPGLSPTDHGRIVKMLDERSGLLEKKLTQLRKPLPKEGERPPPYYAPSIKGARPAPGKHLTIEELPETPPLLNYTGTGTPPALPSGEAFNAYRKRAAKSIAKAADEHDAIVNFTGSYFTSVRDYEEKTGRGEDVKYHPGKSASDSITRAFAKADVEPMTVFRGMHSLPKDVVESMINAKGGVMGLGRGNVGATSSTTWNVNVAVDRFAHGPEDATAYKVVLQIHAKKTIPVETISSFSSENELFSSRDAKFRVLGAARWKGRKRVVVIELEEDDDPHPKK